MKKLSRWAKENPWKARITIVVLNVALLFIAFFTGGNLTGVGVQFPSWLLYIFLSLFLLTALLYPSRQNKTKFNKELYYFRQKTCDFLLAATTFCMMLCIGNKDNPTLLFFQTASASSSIIPNGVSVKPTAAEILASLQYRDKSTLTRVEKRILKQEFKLQLKNYIAAKLKGDKAEGDRVGLIILAIIGALGLLYLLAALSCGIACSGAEGLAIAVLLVGTALIVWGLIAVIRAIKRSNKKVQKE